MNFFSATSALTVVILSVGCVRGGSDDEAPTDRAAPFSFDTVRSVELVVRVVQDGEPVNGAAVTLSEVYIAPGPDASSVDAAVGATLFHGGTGGNGTCRSVVPIPNRYEELDLVVHLPGADGPYTDEGLRDLWGPFAPSSRQTLRVDDLTSVNVELGGTR